MTQLMQINPVTAMAWVSIGCVLAGVIVALGNVPFVTKKKCKATHDGLCSKLDQIKTDIKAASDVHQADREEYLKTCKKTAVAVTKIAAKMGIEVEV